MLVHVGEGQVPVLIEGDDEARGEAPNLVDTAGPNLNFDLLLFPFPVKRFYYLSMLICLVSPRFSLTKSYFAKKKPYIPESELFPCIILIRMLVKKRLI